MYTILFLLQFANFAVRNRNGGVAQLVRAQDS
jgi:hypothetical protein